MKDDTFRRTRILHGRLRLALLAEQTGRPGAARQELVDVKWIVDGLSNWISGLMRPGVSTTVAWFNIVHAGPVATEVETLLDHARQELTRLREQLRQSFDLIASTQASRQIELGRREQRRGQRPRPK